MAEHEENVLPQTAVWQKALLGAATLIAVVGVVYIWFLRGNLETPQAQISDTETSTYTEEKKLEVLQRLEASREEESMSEEEKLRVLESLKSAE